jgi:hypothetical protein
MMKAEIWKMRCVAWKEEKNNKEKFLEVRNYIDDNRAAD